MSRKGKESAENKPGTPLTHGTRTGFVFAAKPLAAFTTPSFDTRSDVDNAGARITTSISKARASFQSSMISNGMRTIPWDAFSKRTFASFWVPASMECDPDYPVIVAFASLPHGRTAILCERRPGSDVGEAECTRQLFVRAPDDSVERRLPMPDLIGMKVSLAGDGAGLLYVLSRAELSMEYVLRRLDLTTGALIPFRDQGDCRMFVTVRESVTSFDATATRVLVMIADNHHRNCEVHVFNTSTVASTNGPDWSFRMQRPLLSAALSRHDDDDVFAVGRYGVYRLKRVGDRDFVLATAADYSGELNLSVDANDNLVVVERREYTGKPFAYVHLYRNSQGGGSYTESTWHFPIFKTVQMATLDTAGFVFPIPLNAPCMLTDGRIALHDEGAASEAPARDRLMLVMPSSVPWSPVAHIHRHLPPAVRAEIRVMLSLACIGRQSEEGWGRLNFDEMCLTIEALILLYRRAAGEFDPPFDPERFKSFRPFVAKK